MIRFRKYNDINYFSYFSITNYVALLCGLLSLVLPVFNNHNSKSLYTLLDILQLNFSSTSIIAMLVIVALIFVFIMNMFFQPSWTVYFANVALIIFLFISPILMNSMLLPLLNLHKSSLTISVGSILLMLSAILFIAVEIYKVSIMDIFVNRNIKEKKQQKLEQFKNARKFKLMNKKQIKALEKQKNENNENETQSYIKIKKPKKLKVKSCKVKSPKKFRRTHLLKIEDYQKQLDIIYKV